MPPNQSQPRAHLFTLRLWVEPFGRDHQELRMQVKHVLSGETRYFRAWPDVATYLAAKVEVLDAADDEKGGPDQSKEY